MVSPARSGVFSRAPDPRLERFTQSVSYDCALARHDLEGSLAHARMLGRTGLLTRREAARLVAGLRRLQADLAAGKISFRAEFEDVHMNLEKALEAKVGRLAGKLHTARSRNDQIALDERLWVREEAAGSVARLRGLQRALLKLAERYAAAPMPGYTHLQPAQPVTCGHYLLAYLEMFDRDAARFLECRARADFSPLGAGAIAGTSLPIDRRRTARALGFSGLVRNSLDAVADRDFLLDLAYAMSVAALHFSRLAEDFILFAGREFGFLELPDSFCTGSSLMPQKRNPDVLELIRGKTGRITGCLLHLMMLLKGLPLAYNRDLQEDKELLFDATRQFRGCLEMLAALLGQVSFRTERMARACGEGHLDATALAEYLVRRGLPFRQAHHLAGCAVRLAMEAGVPLSALDRRKLRKIHRLLDADLRRLLEPRRLLAAYASEGSANPRFVRREVRAWKRRLR